MDDGRRRSGRRRLPGGGPRPRRRGASRVGAVLRVVLVSANFRPRVGGVERFTEILADGLARRGHEVAVVCCRYGDAPPQETLRGFSIERIAASYAIDRRLNVPYPAPDPVSLVRALRRHIRSADVVHVQDALYATSLPALLLGRRHRVPTVLTQHVGFVPQHAWTLDLLERAALSTLGRCARLATLVTALNPSVASWAARQWGLTDVRLLPVGIPSPGAEGDRAELRRSFGLPQDRFVAVFVGRDVSKKGLDVFVASADPSYELVAVTDRETAGDTRVLPFMSPERLQELLRCSDAFVLPSEGEGFPLTLQEALAAGVPVVTTRQPGYEHFLSPDDVLFVERDGRAVREGLLRLAADPELRRRLAERGRQVADRHFGVEGFVGAYEALYEEGRTVTRVREVRRTG